MNIVQQKATPVPGITQQALDAVADPNARAVLQQLVSGWQVRNGQSGDGSNAFVTRGDLGLASSMSGAGGGFGSGSIAIPNPAFLTPGTITLLVNQIEASIMASAFFQSLGTSFKAPAGITKKQTILSNAVGQLSSEVTTLGSSVGDLSAGLQQESTTRANVDGELQAQWTVKTDINGYVAGFGLASTANNSTPFSSFIVRADDFAIGSPSGPGISPQVPFVVYTTPQNIGGQVVQPGVYMTRAFIANGTIDTLAVANAAITQAQIAAAAVGSAQIQNAAIGTAHIQNAAIDTLRVAGRAITAQASWTNIANGGSVNYVASGGNLVVFASGHINHYGAPSATPVGGSVALTVNATGQMIQLVGSGMDVPWADFGTIYNVSGSVTLSFQGAYDSGPGQPLDLTCENLVVFEALR
ncbi:DUF1983 domain-containing protein [Burkholderia sp. Bp8990]|uniref:phage tail tip fiber protein n=1 Tax=Burkholderia sp. Bp8990 TaxID=2184552 RepID=UPI000F5A42FF|nr:DUF1983 domain-containing protein [Burkholderia sp. Bp8990]RQS39780.1 DUF1983 domain-containing protein [Burkholderia sp. Bp8990]